MTTWLLYLLHDNKKLIYLIIIIYNKLSYCNLLLFVTISKIVKYF